jgi:hypothetical protein
MVIEVGACRIVATADVDDRHLGIVELCGGWLPPNDRTVVE